VTLLPVEQFLEHIHDRTSSERWIAFGLPGDQPGQPTVRTMRKRAFPAIIFA
jgi:hypothetical protein